MKKNPRIPSYRIIWFKIRYYQNLKDISNKELATFLQVGERTLHEYDKDAKNLTLEKIENFLYVNNMDMKDLLLL